MIPPRDDAIHQLGREKLGISVRGHHGGPCASALQDFAPGPGTMAAHGRSIAVAKSWIAAASRPRLCGQLGAARSSRCGRRKYRQSPRSHAGESHLNLPLGLGFFVGAIEWGSSDRVGLEPRRGGKTSVFRRTTIGWGSNLETVRAMTTQVQSATVDRAACLLFSLCGPAALTRRPPRPGVRDFFPTRPHQMTKLKLAEPAARDIASARSTHARARLGKIV